jgi:glycosylphosphatidylinositol transamidase (GPIT) subunit GPI8
MVFLLTIPAYAQGGTSGAAAPDTNDYAVLLSYSYFFYEAQQSGVLPSWNRASRANGGSGGTTSLTEGSAWCVCGVSMIEF